jgi:SAM-dependent methyltransferase
MSRKDVIKDAVKLQFGANADKYVTSIGHARGEDLLQVVGWLNPRKHWRVLDIATGGGHTAAVVAPHVKSVFASDLTEAMLAAARAHIERLQLDNIYFVLADAEQLPFLSQSFAAVTCRIAAHHFPHQDVFVQEVARVLTEDGKFLFIDNVSPESADLRTFHNTFEKMRDESHGECLPISAWEHLLDHAGFAVERDERRRKRMAFRPWAERMAATEEQVYRVEQFLLNADEHAKAHFEIEQENGHITSIGIDEWMVLAKKVR